MEHEDRRCRKRGASSWVHVLRRRTHWVPAVALLPFYLVTAVIGWYAFGEPIFVGPPQELTVYETNTPVLEPGQSLGVLWAVDTHRKCPVQIDRWVENTVIHNLPRVAGTITDLGASPVRQSYLHLPKLEAGFYKFRVRVSYPCTPFYTYTIQRPDLQFEVRSSHP